MTVSMVDKTLKLQTDLAMYCRTGIDAPETSIQGNTFQYRRLVFNVINDTLKTAYPLAKKLLGKKRWKKAVAHFFEKNQCQTAQVWRLPLEFYEYYTQNPFPFKKEFPHLLELLLIEWLEIEVFMMEDILTDDFTATPTIDNAVLLLNPELKIVPLTYPVHTHKTKTITQEDKGQYFVSIHRDYYDKEVRFNDLSYPFVEMLLQMSENDTTVQDLKKGFQKYEADVTKAATTTDVFVQFALKQNLILGFKK